VRRSFGGWGDQASGGWDDDDTLASGSSNAAPSHVSARPGPAVTLETEYFCVACNANAPFIPAVTMDDQIDTQLMIYQDKAAAIRNAEMLDPDRYGVYSVFLTVVWESRQRVKPTTSDEATAPPEAKTK